jgi:hypothetical protein
MVLLTFTALFIYGCFEFALGLVCALALAIWQAAKWVRKNFGW